MCDVARHAVAGVCAKVREASGVKRRFDPTARLIRKTLASVGELHLGEKEGDTGGGIATPRGTFFIRTQLAVAKVGRRVFVVHLDACVPRDIGAGGGC